MDINPIALDWPQKVIYGLSSAKWFPEIMDMHNKIHRLFKT